MPYARPTLTQLRQQAQNDVVVGLGQFGPVSLLAKSVIRVLSWIQAGLAYLNYGYLDYIYLQGVPYTATGEALDGWAALKGVLREDATAASGTFVSTGNVVGTSFPSGVLINRGGDGFQYQTNVATTVDGTGTLTIAFVATTAGSTGNALEGIALAIASPIEGINSSGTSPGAITGGTDQEQDSSLRTRMLQAFSAPAHGGDQEDYVTWALDVPGVTRAWCNPNGAGPGTVVVYTMFDEAEAADGGFPQGVNGVAAADTRANTAFGDQLTVANAIYPLQPVTALVHSCAPVADPITFTVAGLGSSNTTANQQAISAALADMFLRLGSPLGITIEPSAWNEAIGAISSVGPFNVTIPSDSIAVPLGSLPTLGTVAFST